jgi:hypothetical protein
MVILWQWFKEVEAARHSLLGNEISGAAEGYD